MILVAPTEQQLHNVLRLSPQNQSWRISSLPERHGCDLLIPTKLGIVGFQRKTLPDLVSSLQDGRLYYELGQLNASATVSYSFLIIESALDTTTDYEQFTEANLSVAAFRSIITKFSVHGTGWLHTYDPTRTIDCALSVSRYLASGNAWHIHRPKQLSNAWGQVTSESYALFLLQSFPGIGPKVAKAIYDHFHTVPIAWTITTDDLAAVPGIGKKRAESLIAALAPAPPTPAQLAPVAAAGPAPA
jgi:ERCC4-type nuclease